jgi:hypothetical protein
MKRYKINYKSTSIEAPDGEFLIGRSDECHLVLDDPSVSRVHAVIVREGESLRVEDRGSRNGVMVNKERIKESRNLKDGDQVAIGHQVIKIALSNDASKIDRTQGIRRCPSCGAWSSGDVTCCTACGTSISAVAPFAGDDDLKVRTAAGSRPTFAMLVELALKAVQVGKLEEAERLVSGIVSSAEGRLLSGEGLVDGDLEKIGGVMAQLAQASKSSKEISRMFSLHLAAKQLMSRELVEKLYDLVRPVGYLACPEMTKYLNFLDSKSAELNPGELFVHRRLQGLIKLCS